MKYDTATPYTAAYVIMRRQGKVAFVLRQNTDWMNGYYGLPSGKIEKGESAMRAAIREAKEEVGVTITPDQLRHILTGDRHDEIDWMDICFEASGWAGEPYNAEPHMHSELSWLNPDDLPENVIPSVRFYIEQIKTGATYAEYGWH
jgi:8-oxo-dGTP pyrophosphatase MutT (NUDIX family)